MAGCRAGLEGRPSLRAHVAAFCCLCACICVALLVLAEWTGRPGCSWADVLVAVVLVSAVPVAAHFLHALLAWTRRCDAWKWQLKEETTCR